MTIRKRNSLTTRYGENAKKANEKSNRIDIDSKKIVIACASLIVCIIILAVVMNVGKKRISFEDYIEVNYVGANGYASAVFNVNSDKLVTKLLKIYKDETRKSEYLQFADSIKADYALKKSDKSLISNGDKLKITVTYDDVLAKEAGIKVGGSKYSIKAKNVSVGNNIDIFEKIDVVFAGISPDAYVVIKNNWEDGFLSQLNFEVQKEKGIAVNDEILVKCVNTEEELGKQGYIANNYSLIYKADKLSSNISDLSQINVSVVKQASLKCIETIESEVADTSFRMIYKATSNPKFVHMVNEETVENIKLLDAKFLIRNSSEGFEDKNKIILIYSSTLKCGPSENTVYYAFVFPNCYITKDGEFKMIDTDYKELYDCNLDFDEMMQKLNIDENIYNISGINMN